MKIILKNTSLAFQQYETHTYSDSYFSNPTESTSVSGNLFDFTSAIDKAIIMSNGSLNNDSGNQDGIISSLIPVSVGDKFLFSGKAKSNVLALVKGYSSTTQTTSGKKVMELVVATSGALEQNNVLLEITQAMVNAGVVAIRAWSIRTFAALSIRKQLD